jgi:hypothetical protein
VKDSAVVDIAGGTATPIGSVTFFLCQVTVAARATRGGVAPGSLERVMSAGQTPGSIDAVRRPAASRGEEATEVGSMPRVIITHDIREVDRWLAGKQERAAALPGATGVTDLVAIDGGHQAAVTFETDDLDALRGLLESMPPEVAAQAESHGVIPPFTVYVER